MLGVPFLLPPEPAAPCTQVHGCGGCWLGAQHRPQGPTELLPPLQVLDEALLQRLGLSPQQLQHLPLHIHLQELVLLQGPIRAPPPPHFLRTLQRLGLPGHLEL